VSPNTGWSLVGEFVGSVFGTLFLYKVLHFATMLQCYSATGLQSYSATVLQCYSDTATVLMCYCATVPKYIKVVILLFKNTLKSALFGKSL
jgi:hypothetical protein